MEARRRDEVSIQQIPVYSGPRGTFLKRFCFTMLLAVGTAWRLDPHRAISQYFHTGWRSEDGLPQNSVQTVLQPGDGYLWMGTQDGLVPCDGIQLSGYTKANGN